ncbi:MAG TPA: ABC transporter ATP-binding protein [Pyrinomonadaceae bacterium]|nr:ABC transporter ATP-binding protein [Pyrinomonadaceae bacterium]
MLELRNITKRFGEVLANDRVSFSVTPGTIHAIVGENGAGKSTAMRIAYGFYTADSGEILINGQVHQIRTPHDAIALGIGMVHQHFMLVEPMTVAENIVLGAEPGNAVSLDLRKAAEEIRKVSDEFKLSVDPNALIETLSVGQQQRVELLKALYRHAQLLILDEPTAVLTPQEVEEFFAILRGMRAQGKTIVIITHKLSEVLAISDEVTVMRDGQVVGNVKTSETNAAELARMMVGREVLLRVEKPDAKSGAPVLHLRDLSVLGRDGSKRLDGISFEVRAGEIVGIAGVEGNGQTELIEVLAGLIPGSSVSGSISFQGRDITRLNARARKELGIAHVPEDRHRRGLLLDFSLAENTILGVHYRKPAVGAGNFMLNQKGIQQHTAQVIRDFDVRPPNPALPARALSGGNQQKLIIGREFELPPKLLLVSQPTRGVDIGAIEFIHRKIVAMRDAGCAVLLVSAELEEVTGLSDRLLVIHKGKIAGEVDPKVATNQEIGLMMTGGRF